MTPSAKVRMILAAACVGLACQDRLVDAEPLEGWHVCTWVNAARVYDEQGNSAGTVQDPRGGNTEICLCLLPEEVISHEYDEWFNDRAYETCLANAAHMGYPEANDCEYWYGQGQWIEMIRAKPDTEDIRCDPEGPSEASGG